MWQKALSCALHTRVIDDDRFHAVIAAIEATLPTDPLIYIISDSAKLVRLDDPAGRLRANMLARNAESLCNGNKRVYVELFVRTIAPMFVVEGEPLGFMLVKFPDTREFRARVPDLVRALGPAARAYRLNVSPSDAAVTIIEGAGRSGPSPESEFPADTSSPSAVPRHLGWVNYWSNESCGLLEFSPEDPRAELFARAEPIAGHGVMLHLTEEPLDLDRPEHLAALAAAYKAFPMIDNARGP